MEEPIRVVYEHREEYEKRKRKEQSETISVFVWIIAVALFVYSIINFPSIDAIIGSVIGLGLIIFMFRTIKDKPTRIALKIVGILILVCILWLGIKLFR